MSEDKPKKEEPVILASPDQLPDDAREITAITDFTQVFYSPSTDKRYIAGWFDVEYAKKRGFV